MTSRHPFSRQTHRNRLQVVSGSGLASRPNESHDSCTADNKQLVGQWLLFPDLYVSSQQPPHFNVFFEILCGIAIPFEHLPTRPQRLHG